MWERKRKTERERERESGRAVEHTETHRQREKKGEEGKKQKSSLSILSCAFWLKKRREEKVSECGSAAGWQKEEEEEKGEEVRGGEFTQLAGLSETSVSPRSDCHQPGPPLPASFTSVGKRRDLRSRVTPGRSGPSRAEQGQEPHHRDFSMGTVSELCVSSLQTFMSPAVKPPQQAPGTMFGS